jgi:serine/threonine protein kinase
MVERDLSGRRLGEFVLHGKIGQGGYGTVYRAAQPVLKRHVAVKVLQKKDDVAEQRFLREAQLASRFDHPFAAHIYAFGVDEGEGLLWIAMELVQGVTLSSWIKQRGPMPVEQFVPLFESVADAVHAAHEDGIVHRDLKPSNIMVMELGSRVLPKLLDFGIAKTLNQSSDGSPGELRPDDESSHPQDTATTVRLRPASQPEHRTVTGPNREDRKRRLTRTGAAFGSRPYMSPEQWCDAQAVGPASDVYALGVIAYEVLTGRVPYTADKSDEFYRIRLLRPSPDSERLVTISTTAELTSPALWDLDKYRLVARLEGQTGRMERTLTLDAAGAQVLRHRCALRRRRPRHARLRRRRRTLGAAIVGQDYRDVPSHHMRAGSNRRKVTIQAQAALS